jgi:hypothetical protein
MRTSADGHIDIELIAARDPSGRMHDHRVADCLTFGIKRPLYAQRPIVQTVHERGALILFDEAEFEARAP